MGDAFITRRGITPEPQLIIESGLIVEWYGLTSNIPEGWALCNGQNDTPNLIDKFIVGAGGLYAVGNTGGSANAVVVSHNHPQATTNTTGNHSHIRVSSGQNGVPRSFISNSQGGATASTNAGGGHGHSVSITTVGDSAVDRNLPPYRGLFHIIKVEA
jgi:hypothetical protein